jgi:hypothetical protein
MKWKFLVTMIITMLLSIQCKSKNLQLDIAIEYRTITESADKIKIANTIISSVENDNPQLLESLLSDELSVRKPLTPKMEKLSKATFVKEYKKKNNEIKTLYFYYGLLFDDEYSLSHLNQNRFGINKSRLIFLKSDNGNGFKLLLTNDSLNLGTLVFNFNNDGQIVSMNNYYNFLNNIKNDDVKQYLIASQQAYLFSDENVSSGKTKLLVNEKIEHIKTTDTFFLDKRNDVFNGPTYVSKIFVPRLNTEGYILDFDYIILPSSIK